VVLLCLKYYCNLKAAAAVPTVSTALIALMEQLFNIAGE
jgi:hypothetical protein